MCKECQNTVELTATTLCYYIVTVICSAVIRRKCNDRQKYTDRLVSDTVVKNEE